MRSGWVSPALVATARVVQLIPSERSLAENVSNFFLEGLPCERMAAPVRFQRLIALCDQNFRNTLLDARPQPVSIGFKSQKCHPLLGVIEIICVAGLASAMMYLF